MRIIGPGRAGRSFSRALAAAGWTVAGELGRAEAIGRVLAAAARDVDLLVISTPDAQIADVAAAVDPAPSAVVAHLSGSLGLDALAPHPRRAAIHPLVSLPDPVIGAQRLADGAWFAIAGDPLARQIVDSLGGHAFEVADGNRAAYHAAACIASNHLVALLGQVERVGGLAGVPLEAYLDLVRTTVDNVARLGPEAALTGPVARADWETVAHHLAALPQEERPAYEAMADLAARLVALRDGALRDGPLPDGEVPAVGVRR